MSEPNPSGTTAIQVSPADLAQARSMIEKFAAIVSTAETQIHMIEALQSDVSYFQSDRNRVQDENQHLHDKIMLLETQLAGEHSLNVNLTGINDDKDAENIRLSTELAQVKRDRDDIAFKHLEVSEELAQANATLDKFRSLLGFPATLGRQMEIGAGQGQPVTDYRSADGPSYPTPPATNEYVAEGASQFPSPSLTVEPSPSSVQGSEHGTSDPKPEPSQSDEFRPFPQY